MPSRPLPKALRILPKHPRSLLVQHTLLPQIRPRQHRLQANQNGPNREHRRPLVWPELREPDLALWRDVRVEDGRGAGGFERLERVGGWEADAEVEGAAGVGGVLGRGDDGEPGVEVGVADGRGVAGVEGGVLEVGEFLFDAFGDAGWG